MVQPRNRGKPKSRTTVKRTPEEIKALDDINYVPKKSSSAKTSVSHNSQTILNSKRRQVIEDEQDDWCPTPYSAFKLLISARFAGALWTTISDCDETYNYWEPTHYLLYGKGFQTWEYSPEFALRSYTYILVHALPAKIYELIFKPNPLLVFFFIRCFLAFLSSATEVFLFRATKRYLGGAVARMALIFSLFAPGMFISSTAYLPSSFSGYMTALAIGAWLEELHELAILAVAVSGILSWPFAALTGFFIAFDIVLIQKKVLLFISWTLISLGVVLLPVILIDSNQYGKLVIAPLNIIKYNILSSKGPDLYGTEPWTYYLLNGFLNFNIAFILTLLSPIMVILSYKKAIAVKEKLLIALTVFLWLAVFIAQPHKEERFLFPIYPLIPLCASISIDSLQTALSFGSLQNWYSKLKRKPLGWSLRSYINFIGFILIILSGLFSSSRIVALHLGYRAPFDIYFNLHRDGSLQTIETNHPSRDITLCYGKEWHRFPTSFFLPSTNWNTRFIESEFKGQLPNLYPPFDPEGTQKIPENMNDLNREEPSRYIPLSDCDFLVDLAIENESPKESNYAANEKEWKIVSEQDFLNSKNSHPLFRAFYIPFLSSEYTTYDRYVFLERRKKRKKVQLKSDEWS